MRAGAGGEEGAGGKREERERSDASGKGTWAISRP